MGALASAAGTLPPWPRRLVRSFAVGLSLTRISVLAHWTSDVVVGFAVGAAVERLIRFWTGLPSSRSENVHADLGDGKVYGRNGPLLKLWRSQK